MPLLKIWETSPEAVFQMNIEQIVTNAGNGKLSDGSECAIELRTFLTQVSSDKLSEYSSHCLANSFLNSGLVLQDVVNELGRRLDYKVQNGLYKGVSDGIGYDGIWSSPEGGDLVVEVKTTDAYRISLDTIAAYRGKLFSAGKLQSNASVLIVVGRQDTGELEAQVRGSRHAWDMRLISVEALLTVVKLKEGTESNVSGAKIRSILVPMEFTRLDALVDVLFTAAKDVEAAVESEVPPSALTDEGESESKSVQQSTDRQLIEEKREKVLSALARRDGKKLIKKSRALYWDATHEHRSACTVSKRYTKKGTAPYWYAYHPTWDAFLAEGVKGTLLLGCMDLGFAFALPLTLIRDHLEELDTTNKADEVDYWHIKIVEPSTGKYALQLPRSGSMVSTTEFVLPFK